MTPLHVRASQNHMATTFDLTVSCAPARRHAAAESLDECHGLIRRLEEELSEFIPESPVWRLNHAPPDTPTPVPESVIELLKRGEEICRLSGGAFDYTAKGRSRSGIHWSESVGTAWRSHEGTQLGFGAIGKGFALDRVRECLVREGFSDFCLVAGGSSIVLSGFSAPDQPWEWGWSWSRDASGAPLGLELRHESGIPMALGISGIEAQGAHLHGTSGPVKKGRSALVGAPSATDADALSTALFVGGWEIAPQLHTDTTPALAYIDDNGVPFWNGIFQKLWGALHSLALLLIITTSGTVIAEEVDLSTLGMEDFTPYVFERNEMWVILPLLSLALVVWHLQKPKRPRTGPNFRERPS